MQHRVGIIGTGGVAHSHMRGHEAVLKDRVQLAAACDLRSDVLDVFCARYNIARQFTDFREMIASGEIDVVCAFTPPQGREEIVAAACEHGLHMFVEKPMGETAKHAVSYVKAAQGAGCKIAVNQNHRWFSEVRATSEVVRSGAIGQVLYASREYLQHRPSRGWRAEGERLALFISGVHIVDGIQWLVGQTPTSVSAVTRRSPGSTVKGEELATLLIQFDQGAVATSTSNWHAISLPVSRMRLDGERGSVSFTRPQSNKGDATWTYGVEGQDPVTRHFYHDFTYSAFGRSLGELLDAVEEGREPDNSGRDNLKTMGILDAAYLSADRGGEPVTLEEVLGVPLESVGAGLEGSGK